jgi:hypothetical protein
MPEDKKICPIMSSGNPFQWVECQQENCQWWSLLFEDVKTGYHIKGCAIQSLPLLVFKGLKL